MREQRNRALEMFAYARCYSMTAKATNQWMEMDGNFMVTSAVNAALALELFFKTLYFLEKGKDFKKDNRYSHDISALFSELNYSTREKIESVFDELIKNRIMNDIENLEKVTGKSFPRDLVGNLLLWKDVFVSGRYLYDLLNREKFYAVFFPEIERSVLAAIHLMKPEWKNTTLKWEKVFI